MSWASPSGASPIGNARDDSTARSRCDLCHFTGPQDVALLEAQSGQGMAPVQGASGSLSGAAGHPASVAALEVLTPEQAAQLLSVSVEDVLASIT